MRSRTHGYDAVFQALADSTRRTVLDLLRPRSLPAGAIARQFPISRPAISRHLRVLRRSQLVQEHRAGRQRLYCLNPEPLKAVDSWLEFYRGFWKPNLSSLKDFVESEHDTKVQGRRTRPMRKS